MLTNCNWTEKSKQSETSGDRFRLSAGRDQDEGEVLGHWIRIVVAGAEVGDSQQESKRARRMTIPEQLIENWVSGK